MLYREEFRDSTPATSDAFQLRRSMRILSRYVNSHLRAEGALRHTQFDVLAVLAAQGRARNCISVLAEVLGLAACTLSRSLKRLEHRGYVCFPADIQDDERSRIPALTDLGREALGIAEEVTTVVIQPRVTKAFRKLPVRIAELARSLHGLLDLLVTQEIWYRAAVRRDGEWAGIPWIMDWYDLSSARDAIEWIRRRRAARYGPGPG